MAIKEININEESIQEEIPGDEIIEVSESSIKKEATNDSIIAEELNIDMSEQLEPETNIRDIKDFIEVLDAVPTHIPKDFFDSIKLFGTNLYIYNYVTQAWVTFTGA